MSLPGCSYGVATLRRKMNETGQRLIDGPQKGKGADIWLCESEKGLILISCSLNAHIT